MDSGKGGRPERGLRIASCAITETSSYYTNQFHKRRERAIMDHDWGVHLCTRTCTLSVRVTASSNIDAIKEALAIAKAELGYTYTESEDPTLGKMPHISVELHDWPNYIINSTTGRTTGRK